MAIYKRRYKKILYTTKSTYIRKMLKLLTIYVSIITEDKCRRHGTSLFFLHIYCLMGTFPTAFCICFKSAITINSFTSIHLEFCIFSGKDLNRYDKIKLTISTLTFQDKIWNTIQMYNQYLHTLYLCEHIFRCYTPSSIL